VALVLKEQHYKDLTNPTRSKTEKMFATIKTTETKLNGRFNTDTILLAVF